MRYITCVVVDEVNTPSEPLPTDARAIVFDGEKYVIYEDGDEIQSDI